MTTKPRLLHVLLAAIGSSDDGTDESDAALLASWIDHGDERACRVLVTRHRRRVVHAAAGVLGPCFAADAEDVAQDAFARAFDRLASLRDRAQFGAWVARIAFHLAIERRRLARMRHEHIAVEDAALQTTDRDADWCVRRAVDELPPVPRAVLHLHYWLGYTVDEIAQLLGMPANTVKSHLSRGRVRVAARVEEPR
jgi:RNA polymerase sigma-70 factor (ECF subfamily)